MMDAWLSAACLYLLAGLAYAFLTVPRLRWRTWDELRKRSLWVPSPASWARWMVIFMTVAWPVQVAMWAWDAWLWWMDRNDPEDIP